MKRDVILSIVKNFEKYSIVFKSRRKLIPTFSIGDASIEKLKQIINEFKNREFTIDEVLKKATLYIVWRSKQRWNGIEILNKEILEKITQLNIKLRLKICSYKIEQCNENEIPIIFTFPTIQSTGFCLEIIQ